MFEKLKNLTTFRNKYKAHPEAMIISCFFNPQNSPYRLKVFNIFYESIKHLNHRIIECVIGDAKPQLQQTDNITTIYTDNLLWHKESILNKIIEDLPLKYSYIFWVDADVIFKNQNWLVDGVKQMQKGANIIQPFSYCVHLDKDQADIELDGAYFSNYYPNHYNSKVWRSFCANKAISWLFESEDYNTHGHVGFAWGAKMEILRAVPLYDKALIGGADHIIAHAAANQLCHTCITKAFSENIDEVNEWSKKFSKVVDGKIGYVDGLLMHIWHGDISKREYLKRIVEFTPATKRITTKDRNGLYVNPNKQDEQYMKDYFSRREVSNDDEISLIEGMLLGEMLMNNDSPVQSNEQPFEGFGGGEFGGGGAGTDWTDNNFS